VILWNSNWKRLRELQRIIPTPIKDNSPDSNNRMKDWQHKRDSCKKIKKLDLWICRKKLRSSIKTSNLLKRLKFLKTN